MKNLSAKQTLSAVVVAIAAAAPIFANAASAASSTSASPVTREGLQNELRALQAAGYELSDNNYPESLQRAQQKLDAQRAASIPSR
ncbi:DUF4148 domain-containing protein [Cupriavidus sp. 2SB]|uniref:DUF4148 domain-containing protein n=1 Tax=Cupriavidus sp. 2SB TaxID=2502199 RepID=UPI0010F8FEF1|nr:DUF4148 domain-containing protein [Cupriavidus sp. 2SB]